MDRKGYTNDFLNFSQDNYVKSNCGDITFYNTGDNDITVNSAVTLQATQFITLPCNVGEIDRTIYKFHFGEPLFAGALNNLVVIRKIYDDTPQYY